MNREWNYMCYLPLLILATGCKKPYNPPVVSSDNHYLVVEGVVNSGNDSTIISLSKTVKITEDVRTQPVANSVVAVEGESGGAIYNLQSMGDGRYFTGPMHLDAAKKYRLHIKTADNKEYASDYVEVKENPPIDSIGFMPKNNALQIYVNTHNATNNTRYYRWDYAETWRFHTKFQSDYIVDPVTKQVRGRRPDEEVYYCFADDKSSNIIIGSSAKLAQDVIYQGLITTIPRDAEKISVRYSILLKQYGLTKDGYQFWENMRKNTEQLGSIFDAQPTQLQGNIHCISNPAEPVIGYLSVTNAQSKRIFIDNSQIPDDWLAKYPYDCGLPDSARYFNPKSGIAEVDAFIIRGGAIALEKIYIQGADVGYTFSTEFCSVCTIRGRVKQPAFWK